MMNPRIVLIMRACEMAHISGYTIESRHNSGVELRGAVWTATGDYLSPIGALLLGHTSILSSEAEVVSDLLGTSWAYADFFSSYFIARDEKDAGEPTRFILTDSRTENLAMLDVVAVYMLLQRRGLLNAKPEILKKS